MSTIRSHLRRPRPRRQDDRARRSGAARPGHGIRRRHGRIRRARRLSRPRSERRDRAGAVHRRDSHSSSDSTAPPRRAASNSRSDSCSDWAWCSDSRSLPSSPTTPGADPSALWQATGATAAFVAALGRVRLRHAQRPLVVGTHVVLGAAGPDRVRDRRDLRLDPEQPTSSTPSQGSGSSARSTIFDFNRLRRASADGAVPIAASIFLDIFNVFLLSARPCSAASETDANCHHAAHPHRALGVRPRASGLTPSGSRPRGCVGVSTIPAKAALRAADVPARPPARRDRPAHLRDHVRRPRRTRVRLDLRLIEHDDVSDEDARRFGLERRVGQVLLDA